MFVCLLWLCFCFCFDSLATINISLNYFWAGKISWVRKKNTFERERFQECFLPSLSSAPLGAKKSRGRKYSTAKIFIFAYGQILRDAPLLGNLYFIFMHKSAVFLSTYVDELRDAPESSCTQSNKIIQSKKKSYTCSPCVHIKLFGLVQWKVTLMATLNTVSFFLSPIRKFIHRYKHARCAPCCSPITQAQWFCWILSKLSPEIISEGGNDF